MMTHHRSTFFVSAGLFAALIALAPVSVASLLPPGLAHAAPPGCSVAGEAYGRRRWPHP